MVGRIRRKLQTERSQQLAFTEIIICPLCDRPIPESMKDAHHLVPKSKGGKQTQFLHRICHRQIHALFTETELARQYSTVEALLAHPEIELFVQWVKRKPDNFFEVSRKSRRIKSK